LFCLGLLLTFYVVDTKFTCQHGWDGLQCHWILLDSSPRGILVSRGRVGGGGDPKMMTFFFDFLIQCLK
jgi:hypothetical protein